MWGPDPFVRYVQKDQEIVELQAQVQQLTENLQKSQQRVRDLEATLTKVYAEMKKPGPAGPVIQNLAEILHNELSEACTNDQKAAWQHSLREVADMTVDMWEASRSALCPTLWGLLKMIFKRQLGNASAAAAQRIKRSLLTAMDSLCKALHERWVGPIGIAVAFTVYSVVRSDIVLSIMAGAGHGVPRRAPQHELYTEIFKVLQTLEVVCSQNVSVAFHCDNTQNGNQKTARMRLGGAFWHELTNWRVPALAVVTAFHTDSLAAPQTRRLSSPGHRSRCRLQTSWWSPSAPLLRPSYWKGRRAFTASFCKATPASVLQDPRGKRTLSCPRASPA